MNTILIKGEHIRKEVEATGVVTPGMQVSLVGAAGGGARKAFALENDLIGGGVDDDYAIGTVIQTGVMPPGAEVYALLGASENVAKGDPLQGDGAGALVALGTGDEPNTIAFAAEAVNNATSGPIRIRVEVS